MANLGRPRKHDPKAGKIRQATKYGPPDEARQLIEEAGTEITDGEGRTPLFYAVSCHSTDLVAWLLAMSANPNHRERTGTSPLHEAVTSGGANPNSYDVHGNSSLWYATHYACLAKATNK